MRKISEIIIHCSATPPDWRAGQPAEAKVAEIRRWHVEERGWSDIGYHYLIDRDGTLVEGRPVERMGAHVRGHNDGTIGVCLLGGHGSSATDAFDDHFTPAQARALLKLIRSLEAEHGDLAVTGHNDYAAKACPGFKVDRWLDGAPPERASLAQSRTLKMSAVAKGAAVVQPVVAGVAGLPWQTVGILAMAALVALVATGIIDIERIAKWRAGDR